MRYLTDQPLERVMMQVHRPPSREQAKPAPPRGHHCYGCKRYGEGCVLPCYWGLEVAPPVPATGWRLME